MLSLIIFIPLIAALGLLMVSRDNTATIKMVTVGAAGASLALSLWLLFSFDTTNAEMQFVQMFHWVPALHINYLVGVDGISLWMVVLTSFLGLLAILFSFNQKEGLRNFMALMLAYMVCPDLRSRLARDFLVIVASIGRPASSSMSTE